MDQGMLKRWMEHRESAALPQVNCEWLLTDMRGSYCSSTVSCANTRRYHALLVESQSPPVDRLALWMRLDELVHASGEVFPLATNFWRSGAVAPQGYRWLARFFLEPCPTLVFELPGAGTLVKQILLHERTVWVNYTWWALDGQSPIELELVSLVNLRSHHAEGPPLRGAAGGGRQGHRGTLQLVQRLGDRQVALCLGQVRQTLAWSRGEFVPESIWYEGYLWPEERARGLCDHEDCLRHGHLRAHLEHGQELAVWMSHGKPARSFGRALRAASDRQGRLVDRASGSSLEGLSAFRRRLVLAADQFLVRRAGHWTVLAGYPWFNDWGRDTMISLPGLTLSCGRPDIARSVLQSFAGFLDHGMLPNAFPEVGAEPSYNTADATLWWAWSLWCYFQAVGDLEFIESQLDGLEQVVEWHHRGTRYGIHVDPADGLVTVGSPQLTWMDAQVGDTVMTPRAGKPVEINALWFNLLKTLAFFSRATGRSRVATALDRQARQVRRAFLKFWGAGYLHDVIRPDGSPDASLRPNQLLALSLPFPVVDRKRGGEVLRHVEASLLTPFGLRTLAPSDPRYQGRYAGGPTERDSRYHQGTVWPWLLGPWADARRYVFGETRANRSILREQLGRLEHHTLCEAGLGTISEVFDGDPPHQPGGCFAQAWSVAEVLRILTWVDEGMLIQPSVATARSPFLPRMDLDQGLGEPGRSELVEHR